MAQIEVKPTPLIEQIAKVDEASGRGQNYI